MIAQIRLLPEQASNHAPQVDALMLFLVAVTVFFTLLIAVLVMYFAIRYRRRSGLRLPEQVGTNMLLELTWTGIPLLITLVVFAWGAKVYLDFNRPPADAMEVYVIGKQWMWKVQHPEGRGEIDELHVPIGVPVKLTMTSQDVIHDFFIPAFRTKMDVIPGRYTQEWFTPTKLGQYHLFCSQYCGSDHSRMVGTVTVVTAADYQQWLAGATASDSPADAGQRLFATLGCQGCHGVKAPSLAGLYRSNVRLADGPVVLADDAYLRESIVDPHAKIVAGYADGVMPSYDNRVNEEQIMDLLAYIKSLRSAATAPAAGVGSGGQTGAGTTAAAPAAAQNGRSR